MYFNLPTYKKLWETRIPLDCSPACNPSTCFHIAGASARHTQGKQSTTWSEVVKNNGQILTHQFVICAGRKSVSYICIALETPPGCIWYRRRGFGYEYKQTLRPTRCKTSQVGNAVISSFHPLTPSRLLLHCVSNFVEEYVESGKLWLGRLCKTVVSVCPVIARLLIIVCWNELIFDLSIQTAKNLAGTGTL